MLADEELGLTNLDGTMRGVGTRSRNAQTSSVHDRSPFIELRGSILDVGIFRDTLLPSLALHSGLSLAAYAVGRANNRVETKDWLWPSAQLTNAWWASIGRRVVYGGLTIPQAFNSLSRPETLLLTGVTLWGGRLFYRLVSRSARRGKDDPRYEAAKKEEGFWDQALVTQFLPEALLQTVITLPFTAPFYHQGGVFTGYHPVLQAFSVGLFSAGLALEVLADYQLDKFDETGKGVTSVNTEGVWSIVRHPNYLGDALVHFSFPILLYASDMLAPIELLGPIANYLFLRYVSGDAQNEASQEERYTGEKKAAFTQYREKEEVNSFWPHVQQVKNQWTWIVIGAGVAGALIEQGFHLMGLE